MKLIKRVERATKLAAAGKSHREIADTLGISAKMAENLQYLGRMDPLFLTLVSDGVINITTAFRQFPRASLHTTESRTAQRSFYQVWAQGSNPTWSSHQRNSAIRNYFATGVLAPQSRKARCKCCGQILP